MYKVISILLLAYKFSNILLKYIIYNSIAYKAFVEKYQKFPKFPSWTIYFITSAEKKVILWTIYFITSVEKGRYL